MLYFLGVGYKKIGGMLATAGLDTRDLGIMKT